MRTDHTTPTAHQAPNIAEEHTSEAMHYRGMLQNTDVHNTRMCGAVCG